MGPNPFQRAPFLVGSCFIQNIGIWDVQIVATELSNDFTALLDLQDFPEKS